MNTVVHADHQIEKRGTVAEHDSEKFRRFGGRVENRVDRDLELLGRRMDARLGLGEILAQLRGAMLDQLDKNFVLGFEMQVEGAEADVGFGRDVGDARLMVALARDDAFGRLDQIDARFLATAIESIRHIGSLSSCLTHDRRFYDENESCVNLDSQFNY